MEEGNRKGVDEETKFSFETEELVQVVFVKKKKMIVNIQSA